MLYYVGEWVALYDLFVINYVGRELFYSMFILMKTVLKCFVVLLFSVNKKLVKSRHNTIGIKPTSVSDYRNITTIRTTKRIKGNNNNISKSLPSYDTMPPT